MLKFDSKHLSLNGIQPAVVAFHIVVVLFVLSVIAKHAALARDFLVVGCDRSCFAASTEILAGIKTKSCCPSNRTSLHPAIVALRQVSGTVSLASVFNYNKVVP